MIGRFFNYVEIKTKITSVFAFLMTIAYLFYIGSRINWKLTLIFFASMFIFDLVTTAINNYIDSKTNDQILPFKRSTAFMIIIVMLAVSTALGLILVYYTDIIVLLVGAICFLCGIFYTYGPVPISRQALGEVLSGFFYGLLIPFLILYINLPEGSIMSLNLSFTTISFSVNVIPMLRIILLGIVPFCTTANIMLANNTCDVEKDILSKRFTLPYYIGNKAPYLFAAIYYLAYVDILIMVMFKVLSPLCLVILITLVPVQKNINIFLKKQIKSKTFITSIKNYIIIMGTTTLMIFISGLVS